MRTPTLTRLLARWEEAYKQGRDIPARELCPDSPELIAELEQAIEAIRRPNALPSSVAEDQPTIPPAAPAELATQPPVTPLATVAFEAARSPAAGDARAPAGYLIEGELGRGGMGVVYKARSLTLQRPCALKMILSGAHSGAADVQRFLTEAQAIARLQHPGIVQVFEVGEHDGRPFMALEFCGGGSLDGKLAKNPLKPREAAALVRTLAEAMQAAHEARVIHRDLKPANVLLTEKGEPKVTDFGLAKKLDEEGATRTGSVMGTPSYMPPEQAEGKKDVGPAADIYALGAILYECLTGRPPFRAATPLDTILQVVSEEPVPPRQLNNQAPVDLETIALKCLHKDPTRRYDSARALAEDLQRFLDNLPILARPISRGERLLRWGRRNPFAAALLAMILATVVAVSWLAVSASQAAADAREQAERAEVEVYAARLQEANYALMAGQFAQARQPLAQCRWDLRGWEHDHLWTVQASGKQPLSERAPGRSLREVALSGDGRWLFANDQTKGQAGVLRWDLTRPGEPAQRLIRGEVSGLSVSRDGRILVGLQGGRVAIWDADSGKELRSAPMLQAADTPPRFSPDGTRVAWVARRTQSKTTVNITQWQTGQEVLAPDRIRFEMSGFLKMKVVAMAFTPDGRRLIYTSRYDGSNESTCRMFVADTVSGATLLERFGEAGESGQFAVSLDGRLLVGGGGQNGASLTIRSLADGKVIRYLPGQADEVVCLAWMPDGTRVVSGGASGTVRVWNVQTAQPLLRVSDHTGRVTGLAVSEGGRLVSCGEDGTIAVRDAGTKCDRLVLPGTSGTSRMSFGSEGRLLTAVGSLSGQTLRVWDTKTGKPVLLTLPFWWLIVLTSDLTTWPPSAAHFNRSLPSVSAGDFEASSPEGQISLVRKGTPSPPGQPPVRIATVGELMARVAPWLAFSLFFFVVPFDFLPWLFQKRPTWLLILRIGWLGLIASVLVAMVVVAVQREVDFSEYQGTVYGFVLLLMGWALWVACMELASAAVRRRWRGLLLLIAIWVVGLAVSLVLVARVLAYLMPDSHYGLVAWPVLWLPALIFLGALLLAARLGRLAWRVLLS